MLALLRRTQWLAICVATCLATILPISAYQILPGQQSTSASGTTSSKATAADLRHFLIQRMEEALERKLITAPVLEAS